MILSANLKYDFRVLHAMYQNGNKKELDDNLTIQNIKERIRTTLRLNDEHREIEYRWHYPDYDSRWCKIIYYGLPDDETEIKEYKKDEWQHWYNPYNDGRDCTGVWFTTSIYVFPLTKLNKTIVYHFQDCDV